MKDMGDGFKVRRQTSANLGGQFGPDGDRRLVVMLERGDMIVLWPKGTRQRVQIAATDVYRYALRCKALRALLEKANRAKEKKAAAKAARVQEQWEKKRRKK